MGTYQEKEQKIRHDEEKKRKEQEARNKRINTYNLEEISKLFNLLGEAENIEKLTVNNVSFDGKTYNLKKGKDNLVITCSDGRCLKLEMQFSSWPESDGYFSSWTAEKSTATFGYSFPNNIILEFTNRVGSYISYDIFKKLNGEKLEKDLELSFQIPKENLSIESSWDFNRLKISYPNRRFDFTSTDIIYWEDYSISSDGKILLKMNGKKVLSLDEVKQFDVDEEKEKIEKLLDSDKTLHSYTKDLIVNAMNDLNKMQEYVMEILKFYEEDIPLCKKVVDTRNNVINGMNNYTFKKEELLFLAKVLAEAIKEEYNQMNETVALYNSPDERAKRLVKSLSEEDLNALKKRINN